MVELLREQWNFILYNDNGSLILSVVCVSVGVFELNYILDLEEMETYHKQGVHYIKELVKTISYNPSEVPDFKLLKTL